MLKFESVKSAANGRWVPIITALGVASDFLRNKHGPCPGCGGTDRWRYDDKNGDGTFFCNQGGAPLAGDGFDLLRHVYGWSAIDCLERVASVLSIAPTIPVTFSKPKWAVPVSKPKSKTFAYAKSIWKPLQDNDRARSDYHVMTHPYAEKKRIDCAAGAARAMVDSRQLGGNMDCIVVPLRNLGSGEFCGIECIDPSGNKVTYGNKGVLMLGNDLDQSLSIHVCEGWADAAAILFQNNGNVLVYAVFSKSRLDSIAQELNEKFSDKRKVIIEREDGSK
ncbi:MAG: primase-helicase zinc-binding domain-containing protein [Oceanicoccus sp.]